MLINCNRQPVKKYEPTLKSLDTHPVPQWFKDAKFGIFIHWGVYSVPAYHEWYLEYMSPKSKWGHSPEGPPYTAEQGDLPDSVFNANIQKEANEYHRKNYGVDFEYDEFIPLFKAEKYDPGAWADLFRQAGARYVVLTAKHGDEFALWPTKYTKRNAMDMGPHRDLAGNLLYAILLEWPGSQITLKSFKDINIRKVSMLGSNEKIRWKQINGETTFSLPSSPVSPYANVLKLECKEL